MGLVYNICELCQRMAGLQLNSWSGTTKIEQLLGKTQTCRIQT